MKITGLSTPLSPRNFVVSRAVTLAAALALTPACLVSDPPEYEEPVRSPPILDLAAAKPFPGEIIVVDTTDNNSAEDRIEISIPIRSEDRGEDLIAALHIDYTFPLARKGTLYKIPASTLEDLTRRVDMSWDVPSSFSGCHQMTLLVSHESTFSYQEQRPQNRYDTAMATWWMNVNPARDDPYTLSDCPNGGEVQ